MARRLKDLTVTLKGFNPPKRVNLWRSQFAEAPLALEITNEPDSYEYALALLTRREARRIRDWLTRLLARD